MYRRYIKPLSDWVIALLLLVVLSPVMLITIFVLLLFQKGHVFFLQERPGLNGDKFKLIKFTSMSGEEGEKIVTPIGRLIRKASIDELPQLINVLKGEMSLVGPRPLLMEYLSLYSPEQHKRHDVKPGITGWAQINGRTSISWKDKFNLDLYYIENYSFRLDCMIIAKTLIMLFTPKNYPPEEKFDGNN